MRTVNILLALLFTVVIAGCSSTYPNRNPVGEAFPSVAGKSLAGEEVVVPDAFRGEKVILVLAYEQDAQFDVDRWGIGFFTAGFDLPPVYEIPTIPGLLPSIFKEAIDGGMRKGIPKESWRDVITVYGGDGGVLSEWTGTENDLNARIVLLDEQGVVLWFHDRGYGLPPLQDLLETLKKDSAAGEESPAK
jgi:hypothetical protein